MKTNFAFVAEENGEIVGIAMGRLVGESGLARLGWIGVHPTRQNKGIGRALLEKATEHCRAEGCHKITLYTSPVLIPAINLYLKYSFVPEAYLQRMVECRLHQNEQMAIALPNPSREYSPKLLRYLSSSLSTVNKRLLLHARQLYP